MAGQVEWIRALLSEIQKLEKRIAMLEESQVENSQIFHQSPRRAFQFHPNNNYKGQNFNPNYQRIRGLSQRRDGNNGIKE